MPECNLLSHLVQSFYLHRSLVFPRYGSEARVSASFCAVTLQEPVMSELEIIVNDYANLLRRQKSSLQEKL